MAQLENSNWGWGFRGHGAMVRGDKWEFLCFQGSGKSWLALKALLRDSMMLQNIHITLKNSYRFVIFLSWFQLIFELMMLNVGEFSTD